MEDNFLKESFEGKENANTDMQEKKVSYMFQDINIVIFPLNVLIFRGDLLIIWF